MYMGIVSLIHNICDSVDGKSKKQLKKEAKIAEKAAKKEAQKAVRVRYAIVKVRNSCI